MSLPRRYSGRKLVLPGWHTPPMQVSSGAQRLAQVPLKQSSQLAGLHLLTQAPPEQRWQGPQLSRHPCAVQVWQTGSQNDLQEPDWQLRQEP